MNANLRLQGDGESQLARSQRENSKVARIRSAFRPAEELVGDVAGAIEAACN